MTDPKKPRYYTVNITVENEDGELFAVWRTETPYSNVEGAIEDALRVTQYAPIDIAFDRMDDQ